MELSVSFRVGWVSSSQNQTFGYVSYLQRMDGLGVEASTNLSMQ